MSTYDAWAKAEIARAEREYADQEAKIDKNYAPDVLGRLKRTHANRLKEIATTAAVMNAKHEHPYGDHVQVHLEACRYMVVHGRATPMSCAAEVTHAADKCKPPGVRTGAEQERFDAILIATIQRGETPENAVEYAKKTMDLLMETRT